MQSLLVYPTHRNLAEELSRYVSAGLDAVSYPTRTTKGTELQEINCWNEDADRAEAAGFPVGRTVCLSCQQRKQCLAHGYLQQVIAAGEAPIALATHARVEHNGFAEMCDDRDYVAVHEDPVQLLNPTVEIDVQDLACIREMINRLLSDPKWLDWFGEERSRDDSGNEYDDEKKRIHRQRLMQTTNVLADLLDDLQQSVESAQQTTRWEPCHTVGILHGYERFLWWISKVLRLHVRSAPWKFLLPTLSGQLQRSTIIVTQKHLKGMKQGTTQLSKTVIGVTENHPPAGVTVWFDDATLTRERLEGILGRSVHDGTPRGEIARQKSAVQYIRDITRQTSLSTTVSMLRGLLAKHRESRRVGLMTHRPQLKAIDQLEHWFRRRIVMSTYFGSGDERSSNAWYQDCDLLIILGTPRVPPEAIMKYLIQVGEQQVACSEPVWGAVYWQGRTTTGEIQTFEGRGFHDRHWRNAHRDCVRAALVQAIGRGRLILDTGSDVIVVSTEECGLRVIDEPVPRLNDSAIEVFDQVRQLTAKKSNKSTIDFLAVSTAEVAQALNRPARSIRHVLAELESFHLIQRDGPRSGWSLTSTETADSTHDFENEKEVHHVQCD